MSGAKHITLPVKEKILSGYDHLKSGQTRKATEAFLAAWRTSKGSLHVLQVCGDALVEMGERDSAFTLIEEAISQHGQTEQVSLVMANLATRMNLHDIAEKAMQAAIGCNPNNPSHYVNLTQSMAKNGRVDDAISLLQEIIPIYPDYALLWNAIGVLVKHYKNKHTLARTFFEQAYALAPQDVNILVNNAYGREASVAIELLEKALEFDPENSTIHMSLAMEYFSLKDFSSAWPHYEYRLDWNSSELNAPRYVNNINRWKGQKLKGKSLLVMAEQGIGDEIFFAINMPALIEQTEEIIISCDPRLKSIYERSFPIAHIVAYEDYIQDGYRYRTFPELENKCLKLKKKIDFSIPLASIPQFLWNSPHDIPSVPKGYLKPCTKLTNTFAKRLMPYAGKRKIGLSWRSGSMGEGREFGYFGIPELKTLKELKDTVFICLQYGVDNAEIQTIRNEIGLDLIVFDDIDLKHDIEANLAIMKNLDHVVGPNIATQMMAFSSGICTSIITWGLPWWAKVDTPSARLTNNGHCQIYNHDGCGWQSLMKTFVEKVNAAM